jgi:hypothetical protein
LAGGEGGDYGEENGGFAGFGWGVEGDGSASGDEGPRQPFFVGFVCVPEFVPVDEVGEFESVFGFGVGVGLWVGWLEVVEAGFDGLVFDLVEVAGGGGSVSVVLAGGVVAEA